MNGLTRPVLLLLVCLAPLTACSTAPDTLYERDVLNQKVKTTIERFKRSDPLIARWFDGAAGYAVFPEVGKGGLVVGGAYGRGELYEGGRMTGWCDLSQGSVGLQAGGQSYSEVVFFQTARDIERFKYGDMEFAAQTSAIAATAGASADADYRQGVVVFTLPTGGLMYEASVGGQRFTFVPKPGR